MLTGGWTTDSAYCTLDVATPTVSPSDTYGIFSFSVDNLTNTVLTMNSVGSGTYTITTTASNASGLSSTVTYDVVVVYPCIDTVLSIDDSVIRIDPTVTLT